MTESTRQEFLYQFIYESFLYEKEEEREREGEKEGNVFISIITYPSVDARLVYSQDTLFTLIATVLPN